MSAATSTTATLADFGRIWTLMRGMAPKVPFQLESEQDQEAVLTEIMSCCTSGLSPVLLDEGKKEMLATLLVRRDQFDWGFRNSPALHVTYVALAEAAPSAESVKALVEGLTDQRVPVYFSLKGGNGLDLAGLLEGLGFEHSAKSEWGDLYLWEPKKPH